MNPTFVYSGTFDPPTLGHFSLLQKALQVFPKIFIVCSDHSKLPTKFTLEERVELWKHYPLPEEVVVETFDDFLKRNIPGDEIVLIRGLRSEGDGAHEARVLLDSAKNANVTKSFTLVADPETEDISSSRVWEEALQENWATVATLVLPAIVPLIAKKTQETTF